MIIIIMMMMMMMMMILGHLHMKHDVLLNYDWD